MTISSGIPSQRPFALPGFVPGLAWLAVLVAASAWLFRDGLDALRLAWSQPEYSHGPLIPLLSGLMFLRELKQYPPRPGAIPDRWPGVAVIVLALTLGAMGKLSRIDEIVAYATILWVAGVLLISFGWTTGRHFWPPVVHLIYMLPLPGVLYYKMSSHLQLISSELGVGLLQMLHVPVYLEGNIIDLGVIRMHVAEACSGLRYLFPILSFSYVFAILYRGPKWHKAVLLISAVPITIVMNSVRIAVAGVLANRYGLSALEGFSHFFEGWVIFVLCVALLLGLARLMLMLHPGRPTLSDALDLDTTGMMAQLGRIRLVQPSRALIAAALIAVAAVVAWQAVPANRGLAPSRTAFALFPQQIGAWHQQGPEQRLVPSMAKTLAADDYHQITLSRDAATPVVGLFTAYYVDQSKGGVHSPEICLPSSGWEIARLDRIDIGPRLGLSQSFNTNLAIIQKGQTRMMVFYWFQQGERRVAWDFAAKLWLLVDGIRTGQTDGGLVRLTTVMAEDESPEVAEARLLEVARGLVDILPRFMPED